MATETIDETNDVLNVLHQPLQLYGAAQGVRPELPKTGLLRNEEERKSTISVLVA